MATNGLTIGNELGFEIRINDLSKVASGNLKGLGKIQNSLTILQARVLYNSFTLSQFNYCSLILMHSNKIYKTTSIKYNNVPPE